MHPEVVEAMREVGPQRLTVELAQTAGLLATMGAASRVRSDPVRSASMSRSGSAETLISSRRQPHLHTPGCGWVQT
jgi:hypothetical protein